MCRLDAEMLYSGNRGWVRTPLDGDLAAMVQYSSCFRRRWMVWANRRCEHSQFPSHNLQVCEQYVHLTTAEISNMINTFSQHRKPGEKSFASCRKQRAAHHTIRMNLQRSLGIMRMPAAVLLSSPPHVFMLHHATTAYNYSTFALICLCQNDYFFFQWKIPCASFTELRLSFYELDWFRVGCSAQFYTFQCALALGATMWSQRRTTNFYASLINVIYQSNFVCCSCSGQFPASSMILMERMHGVHKCLQIFEQVNWCPPSPCINIVVCQKKTVSNTNKILLDLRLRMSGHVQLQTRADVLTEWKFNKTHQI